MVEYEDELIYSLVERELKEILRIDKVQFLNLTRWKRAIPQYTLGYGKYLDLAKTLEGENPGLFLTGNYLYGVSVADCIRASYEVAEKAERFLTKR